MKIVFLTRRYLPHIGGVELHIQKLVEALGSNYRIIVITEQHDSSLPLKEKIGQVTVFRIAMPNQQTDKFSIWWWVLKHLNLLFSADIIHIHDVFFWILPFRWALFWKRIFVTFHGYEGVQNPNWKQIMWHQIAEIFSNSNICIGGFHQKWYGVTPTVTSYGAVDKIRATPQRNGIKKEKNSLIQIIYAGRLASDTGILVYLEALRILQEKFSLHLDIFGDGPEKEVAENYVLQYKLNVTFHGFVPQNKIQWTLYDVAFVSRYLAILESFSAGIPVIAQYNVEIKKDYLELSPFKNWIFTAQTTSEVVHSFEQVTQLQSFERIRLAQDWANQQTWGKMAESYKGLWK